MGNFDSGRGFFVDTLKDLGLICSCGCQDSAVKSTYDSIADHNKPQADLFIDALGYLSNILSYYFMHDGLITREMFLFYCTIECPYEIYYGDGELFYVGDPSLQAEAGKYILDAYLVGGSMPTAKDYCSCELHPESPCPAEMPLTTAESPIILDLDGDGVETSSKEDGSNFDHDGNRFAEKSGWVGADDALLVWDRDGNEQIDGGNELFGNNYTLANGMKAANGFEALKEFDSNSDSVVDKNDERWSELQLWQDKNGNGKVDDGELLTLEEAGVAGLNTGYTNQRRIDENGNQHLQTGSFIREDGMTGKMTDVWFQTDLSDTIYLDEIAINCPSILGLPNLRGYGSIPSLHQAMAIDETGALKALVNQFVNAEPLAAKNMIWDIIFAWTGVADMAPNSYRGFTGDGRKLYAMERLTGTIFGNGAPNFGPRDHAALEDFFAKWESQIISYFLLSVHYNELYSEALRANAKFLEDGCTSCLDSLVETLRTLFDSGDKSLQHIAMDFVKQLGVYDTRGYSCSRYLEALFIEKRTTDVFANTVCNHLWNVIEGEGGNDSITGTVKGDVLFGNNGNDMLYAGDGNDILHGGTGNDILEGYNGDDIYLFGIGDGHDIVTDFDNVPVSTVRNNIVRLGKGIGVNDIEFLLNASSSDLIIRIKSTGETLTIKNMWAGTYGIQAIEFADGTVWGMSDIRNQPLHMTEDNISTAIYPKYNDSIIVGNDHANSIHGRNGNDIFSGGGGDDKLYGGDGNDVLHGGEGTDVLSGSNGDDVYLFGIGDGHDIVEDFDNVAANTVRNNIVRLGAGIGVNDIEFFVSASSSDLIICIKSTGETLTIKNMWTGNYGIQAIEFVDGTVWGMSDIRNQPLYMAEDNAAVTINTKYSGATIVGNNHANTIRGGSGNDIFSGGGGDDKLYGDAGSDVLWGGTGTDYLSGDAGDDTYLFNRGDSADTIYDASGNDSLIFGDDIAMEDLWFSRSGYNLVIDVLGTGDKVTINNWYSNNAYKVETISAGGMELVSGQMEQLIQAMASFGAPSGVDGQWMEEEKEAAQSVVGAYWKPASAM